MIAGDGQAPVTAPPERPDDVRPERGSSAMRLSGNQGGTAELKRPSVPGRRGALVWSHYGRFVRRTARNRRPAGAGRAARWAHRPRARVTRLSSRHTHSGACYARLVPVHGPLAAVG